MRQLAARIEYSPATIYQHFKSKDELFRCLVKASIARLGELQARAAASEIRIPWLP
jgi:AcrR family transcriptional regulator